MSTVVNKPNVPELAAQVSTFSGEVNEDFEAWDSDLIVLRELHGLSENSIKAIAVNELDGRAKKSFYAIEDHLKLSFDECGARLIDMFGRKLDHSSMMNELQSKCWKPEECFRSYFQSKLRTATRLSQPDAVSRHYIVQSIHDYAIRIQAAGNDAKRNHDLLHYMLNLECNIGSRKRPIDVPSDSYNTVGKCADQVCKFGKYASNKSESRRAKCFICNDFGHIANECLKPKRDPNSCTERNI